MFGLYHAQHSAWQLMRNIELNYPFPVNLSILNEFYIPKRKSSTSDHNYHFGYIHQAYVWFSTSSEVG